MDDAGDAAPMGNVASQGLKAKLWSSCAAHVMFPPPGAGATFSAGLNPAGMVLWGLLAQMSWEESRESPGKALATTWGTQGTLDTQTGTERGLVGVFPSPNGRGQAQT